MELNIESKLNNTRNLLQELGNSVSNLVNSSPDVFADPGIQSCLQDFLKVYQEAVQRLENPSFRIATLGTTSSGKSTIVNALIGRKIAPIEAGEMSGGVLTIKHSQEQKLIIEKTEDAVWDTGESTGSDEDLYQRISTVMHSYHNARKKREYVAPQIAAHVPLLPASNSSLLGLPNGIAVELIDLPGLKSVQDQTNLATIQKQVNKAFSLVALDYMQVDDEHRKCLLKELKKVVEYLKGKTESKKVVEKRETDLMIFILNRVDQRGTDDLPLSERINKLREEIKEVLSLQELPDVLPFNARLLYYAQCAWGSGAFNEPSNIDPKTRLERLKALFRDCASTIDQYTDQNWDLDDWFNDIKRDVKRDKPIDDNTMRKILHYSLEWSGGRELWDRFRVRIQESFSELVILPALLEVFNNYDALEKLLQVVIQARKINNQEQVEQERDQIAKIRQNLQKNIKKIGKEFKGEIEELIENLKKDDRMINDKVVEETKKIGRNGFERIYDAVAEVEGDLTTSLIVPVRDAFKNNQGAFELRDKLGEVTSPVLADDIAKAYDNVSLRLSKFSSESEYLVKRVRADDDKGKKELERDQWDVRFLYHRMREAISARAEFVLQSKAKQFEQALESLVDEQVKKLKVFLTEGNFSSINLEQAAISDLRKKLAQDLPKLPEKFFDLQDNFKPNSSKKTEVVGQKTEKETRTKTEQEEYEESYKNGSCLKTTKTRTKTRPVTRTYQEVVTRDITQDVEYIELFLPPHDLMAKQWSSGIEKGKDSLWDILLDWILQRLDNVSTNFEESVDEITNLAERALQQQLTIIKENFEQEKLFWLDFEIKKDYATSVCENLKEDIASLNRL
ncbi:dynamin family protein [Planktothrix agardhii]|uniref:dynamin family protein n=1 Tax=Planktothrix agardhii TaxID=1160 RepID=UPI002B1F93E4|nr:dynamin family protein [Planktothrix agardhii]MEA5562335.1 dynamin family protein [Planktothrix agardhii UHCC 0887]